MLDQDAPSLDTDEDADSNLSVEPFDEGDATELRLSEEDIVVLETEGLTTAKSIRALKDPGVLAGLCGWEQEHATLVMNRANSLRIRELHSPKTRGNDGESKQTA